MATTLPAPEDIMLPPSPPESVSSPNGDDQTAEEASLQHNGITSEIAQIQSPLPPPLHIPPPRTRSPLAKTHLRSRSFAGSPAAPCMTRAHSSPGLDSRGRYIFASSQGRHELPLRRPSPLRTSSDEATCPTMSTLNISEPIAEQPEPQSISESPRAHLEVTSMPAGSLSPGIHNTFPRLARRRPSSPLNPSSTTSGWPRKTIPDIPDAEAAAIEADRIAKLKAAADKADESAGNSDVIRRRNAMDLHNSPSLRFAMGRKRWSVCGAEGRQDLDLETIWED
ncbi:hypothetical protein CIHG_10213 [Coccidioides immitis H538.4]|uniref:Basic proline-rich protein n=1 Tax=Coccidioides immitis H538.4 TaxID=396776 RepID=A0A0J8S5E3_COCIT|nr:hypothetical protein CIHG_10213 [Coccidioides immitis H538.4]